MLDNFNCKKVIHYLHPHANVKEILSCNLFVYLITLGEFLLYLHMHHFVYIQLWLLVIYFKHSRQLVGTKNRNLYLTSHSYFFAFHFILLTVTSLAIKQIKLYRSTLQIIIIFYWIFRFKSLSFICHLLQATINK